MIRSLSGVENVRNLAFLSGIQQAALSISPRITRGTVFDGGRLEPAMVGRLEQLPVDGHPYHGQMKCLKVG